MEERIRKVTTSEIKCFKSCRRKYYLEYVRQLKPVETPKALEVGTLYHAGLEVLLSGGSMAESTSAINRLSSESAKERGVDEDEYATFTAIAMARAFYMWEEWRRWKMTAVEKVFEVNCGYAKRLIGKIDGLIEHEGKNYLVEHKTTSVWGEDGARFLENLELDEQATNYIFAYEKMLEDGVIDGGELQGILYCAIEKPTIKPYQATPADQRKYTKDGALYKSQHERDEEPMDFFGRLCQWYEERQRCHAIFITRNREEIEAQIADMNAVIRDMAHAEREETYYKNADSCKIMPCPYRAKCLVDSRETDCLFINKNQKNEELTK